VPFVLAWAGIPLWMIVKHTDIAPDFSEANAYLTATGARLALHGGDPFQDPASQLEPQPIAA
jgi:hypothetical protein